MSYDIESLLRATYGARRKVDVDHFQMMKLRNKPMRIGKIAEGLNSTKV